MRPWTPWTKGSPPCVCGRAAATHRHKGRTAGECLAYTPKSFLSKLAHNATPESLAAGAALIEKYKEAAARDCAHRQVDRDAMAGANSGTCPDCGAAWVLVNASQGADNGEA